MTIKEFTAYQPICDVEGCDFTLNGDYEEWFTDRPSAAEAWEANEQWTDGTAFFCETHAITEPHAFVAAPNFGDVPAPCDRCRIPLDEHEVPT